MVDNRNDGRQGGDRDKLSTEWIMDQFDENGLPTTAVPLQKSSDQSSTQESAAHSDAWITRQARPPQAPRNIDEDDDEQPTRRESREERSQTRSQSEVTGNPKTTATVFPWAMSPENDQPVGQAQQATAAFSSETPNRDTSESVAPIHEVTEPKTDSDVFRVIPASMTNVSAAESNDLDFDPVNDTAVHGESLIREQEPRRASSSTEQQQSPIPGLVPTPDRTRTDPFAERSAANPVPVAPMYEDEPHTFPAAATTNRSTGGERRSTPTTSSMTGGSARKRRGLPLALIVVIAVVAVAAIFGVGMLIPQLLGGSSPQALPTQTVTATPEQTNVPVPADPAAALPAATYAWNQLRSGTCVSEFTDAWQSEYNVVDCGEPHQAQVVALAPFADESADFPGESSLATQIGVLCGAPGLVSEERIEELGNLQIQGSYPVTQAQWDSGERNYSCFVSRSDGGDIIGSVAGN